MKDIRREEFIHAMDYWSASYHILPYGDLMLSEEPIGPQTLDVLNIVRDKQFGSLFSFHPYEMTPIFDHPDHNRAGEITKRVASVSDVDYYHPEIPALDFRPSLFFWTTDKSKVTHVVPLSEKTRQRREEYLFEYYPSQFSKKTRNQWGPIFDRISLQENGSHQEFYTKIR
jgi:LmbE family N-acetylglucosaminyl deacetylase